MPKKLIAACAVVLIIAAGAGIAFWLDASTSNSALAPGPATIPSRVAIPQAAPVAAAPSAQPEEEQESDGAEDEIVQTLNGKDFTAEVSINGNDRYRNLAVTMADGVQVSQIAAQGGEPGELINATFGANDSFELASVIPGEAREQILLKGEQMLPQGLGSLQTYAIYRIEGTQLREIFNVVTGREREEDADGKGSPAQKLAATVEHMSHDGQPAIGYRVTIGAEPARTIVFVWNGKNFADASGAYDKLAAPFLP